MRRADKADLQNCLVRRVPTCVTDKCPTGVFYVVDGGAMLQRLPWPKSATYIDICKLYIHYVHNHFSNAVVVFDGYLNDPSTKDETHQMRVGSEMGVDVDFILDMFVKMKTKPFLANQTNKQRFINLLGAELKN